MSAYPIMLDGAAIDALVVGGGAVAARKVRALLDAGAWVRIVAPQIHEAIEALAADHPTLVVVRAPFSASQLDGATLVIAATNDAGVNASVAALARERRVPVNVADAPDAGTFVTPAVHRAGDMVVAVTAGGLPAAAARIRDAVAARLDDRYVSALRDLVSLRRAMLDRGDRERWQAASADLVGADFVALVESGALPARIDAWR